jgi:hypothetical protein
MVLPFFFSFLMNRKYKADIRNNTEVFSIVVDNYRHVVEEELFNNCNEGDEVLFIYAPWSRHLLGIQL